MELPPSPCATINPHFTAGKLNGNDTMVVDPKIYLWMGMSQALFRALGKILQLTDLVHAFKFLLR
jgi:hypothetical protein